MNVEETVVIVGAGQAGGEVATSLRQQGYEGRVVLVGDEAHPPYQRPPLSKGFLLGKVQLAQLYLKPEATYERFNIALKLGTRVTAVEREAREVVLHDGSRLAYDKLVLATGGRARMLELPGVDPYKLGNLFYLRSIPDVEGMRSHFVAGKHLVLIGAGYVGLEVAAAAVQLGVQVTVIDVAPRVLSRVTGPEVSGFIEGVHRDRGVTFRMPATVKGVTLDEAGEAVREVVVEQDGVEERIAADVVLVGIGLVPNTELAEAAGLAVDDGIVVDALAQTSDPRVLAVGDCANQPSAYAGRRIRLESVPNAMEHARVAAATVLGKAAPTPAVPWFWSEQYGMRLQLVGLSTGYDRCVVRGSMENRAFSAFYLADGHLIAADVVGRPADFVAAKKLVAAKAVLDPAALADENVALATLG
ncbi:NAD(P)/FAD-dependent oxidoreductase [Chondromyces crocatus]|uniref:Pyridine nucleotide-disulfide oxidoreductase n=1 Tax=Chondromyces crocatus TaxID=52 RepID=A0A0K1EAC8_CHOCO|nr:FAD-dependent oxidoreductase [Chondromyces crocatus]AKT37809.1 pyridine nucleotide-disulfide oxidoreductase [Chondromyces crocatus]